MCKTTAIEKMAEELLKGRIQQAKEILTLNYPFAPIRTKKRQYTELQKTRLFMRDGFIDRYTGKRLVFPAALRIISHVLPEDFPYHPNWKMDETHIAYWELSPTTDHVFPISRGGKDDEQNWVSTSMLTNSIKAQWTLEELRWELHSVGDIHKWDGLMGWFLEYAKRNPEILSIQFFSIWHNAALKACDLK